MPACITHNLFAKKVLDKLAEKEKVNLCAYFWGAQGPDFLFCHRYFPWMGEKYLKPYGNLLHEMNPVKTLGAVRDFLKEHGDPAYRSYAEGLLCHYALDSTAHPYINALAEELVCQRSYENRTTMHGEIEAALDAIILRRETGKLPSEISLGKMFPKNEAVQKRIAKLYKDLIFRTLDKDVPETDLYQATCDAHLVFSCVTDRTGLKKRLFDLLERGKPHYISSHFVPLTERDDVDYGNLQQREWHFQGQTSSQTFFDLFDEAEELAGDLIADFAEGDLAALTKERPFG